MSIRSGLAAEVPAESQRPVWCWQWFPVSRTFAILSAASVASRIKQPEMVRTVLFIHHTTNISMMDTIQLMKSKIMPTFR